MIIVLRVSIGLVSINVGIGAGWLAYDKKRWLWELSQASWHQSFMNTCPHMHDFTEGADTKMSPACNILCPPPQENSDLEEWVCSSFNTWNPAWFSSLSFGIFWCSASMDGHSSCISLGCVDRVSCASGPSWKTGSATFSPSDSLIETFTPSSEKKFSGKQGWKR